MGTIEDRVKKVISHQLNADFDRLVPSASLMGDLNADELDVVELTIAIEDEFDIIITDEDASHLKTVDDVVKLVESTAKRRA